MLMKKISLLLVGVLALFSCEQEELDNFVCIFRSIPVHIPVAYKA